MIQELRSLRLSVAALPVLGAFVLLGHLAPRGDGDPVLSGRTAPGTDEHVPGGVPLESDGAGESVELERWAEPGLPTRGDAPEVPVAWIGGLVPSLGAAAPAASTAPDSARVDRRRFASPRRARAPPRLAS